MSDGITPKELKKYAERCISLTNDMLDTFCYEGKTLDLDKPDKEYLIIAIMAAVKDAYRKGVDIGWKIGINDKNII